MTTGLTSKNLTDENERLSYALQAAMVGTWDYNLLTGQAQWSAICKHLFGLAADAPVTAAMLLGQVHPEDKQRVEQANARALDPNGDGNHNIRFRTLNPVGGYRWIEAKGKTIRNSQGQIARFSGIVQEVTQQVLDRKKIDESEAKMRAIIAAVPAAMVLFVGRELIVDMPSQNFIDIIDRGPNVTGKPLSELMPELESQSFLKILDNVYTTGKPYSVFGTQVSIEQQDGSRTNNYFNLIYTPLFTTEGQVYAILSIASDVTNIIEAKLALEEAQESLKGAIELAELATWSMNIQTRQFSYSERFMDWLGFSEDTKTLDEAYDPLPEDYRQLVAEAIEAVIQPGSSGLYQHEHPIINRLTGQVRIIHAQAKVFYNAAGEAISLTGTAQDVTAQRQLQLALEHQVKLRTEELAAANQELIESTDMLLRTNDNLQRFAYIASHDLQEPLRKIQSFGDLLKNQYASQLGDGIPYLERMQLAASRMSTLIRDLLSFSRISTRREMMVPVPLNQVLDTVLNDLDLRIQETGATVTIGNLPVVDGEGSQFIQLFTNLVSNALKFVGSDVAGKPIRPIVRVSTDLVAATELPKHVKPARAAEAYHRIDVVDNGIGFDEKYLDRIFQVFQRLHSKNSFAGTGIGLAISEKVAINHGGAITASSQPGQGATFSVYLPV